MSSVPNKPTSSNTSFFSTLDNYIILKTLRKGPSIKLKLIKTLTNPTIYVCKVLKIRPIPEINTLRLNFCNEICNLREFSHKNIISIHYFSEYSCYNKKNRRYYYCMYYTMDYCEKGDLLDYVSSNPNGVEENIIKLIFSQIINAITFLHSKGYAHGDLRLENFVMNNDMTVKLIDFEYTKKINRDCFVFEGSNYYRAPEILQKQQFCPLKADIFSAGCVLFALVFGCPAFYNAGIDDRLFNMLCFNSSRFWEFFENKIQHRVSENLKNLMEDMLKINPKERINIESLASNDWILSAA